MKITSEIIFIIGFLLILSGCFSVNNDVHLPEDSGVSIQNKIITNTPFATEIGSNIIDTYTTQTITPIIGAKGVSNLFIDMSNINLPRIWGLEPGLSSYIDAENLISLVNKLDTEGDDYVKTSNNGKGGLILIGYFITDTEISGKLEWEYLGTTKQISVMAFEALSNAFKLNNEIAQFFPNYGNDEFLSIFQEYQPSQIMDKFGIPGDIYIVTRGKSIDYSPENPPISIILSYPHKSIAFEYFGVKSFAEKKITFCPNSIYGFSIISTNKDQGFEFSKVYSHTWIETYFPYSEEYIANVHDALLDDEEHIISGLQNGQCFTIDTTF